MTLKHQSALRAGLLVSAALLGVWPFLASAQTQPQTPATAPAAAPATATAPASASLDTNDDTVVLSPFTVVSDNNGYAASNAISGSRVNSAIKDIPLPIHVITSEFISDIGATNLRDSLSYQAGIMLQTQNDLENNGSTYGSAYGAGGVNNPAGLTSNINQVQLKIRGFITNNVLRDGFLRASASDSLNIDRIEVVEGPNALLYGTGNFGGVVDYLTKAPMDKQQGSFDVSFGTYDFVRTALDVTGPLSVANHLDYRLDASVESSDTQIDFQKNSHYFLAPSFSWAPTPTTKIDLDLEYMKSKQNGYSLQAFRAVAGGSALGINNDQAEAVAFYFPPGSDPRSINLGGPSNFNDQQTSNIELKATQQILKETEILPQIDFFIGYNHSRDNFQTQSVNGQINGPILTGPGANLAQTITTSVAGNSIGGQGVNNLNIVFGNLPGSVIKYGWNQNQQENVRDQERVEFTAHKALFKDKWYSLEDQLLVGYSEILNNHQEANNVTNETSAATYNYKSPLDLTPIVFGVQGDGSPDAPMYQNDVNNINKGWDAGAYLNNYLKMLRIGGVDRIVLMTGVRKDKINNWSTDTSTPTPTSTPSTSTSTAPQTRHQSTQNGVMIALTKNISIYGLQAQGIQPNLSGLHDATTGLPVGVDYAKSKEYGVKFDFLEGKLSGTISHYEITKTAFAQEPWYAPAPIAGKLGFNPNKDIVYQLNGGFNASGQTATVNGVTVTGTALPGLNSAGGPIQNDPTVIAAWNKAVADGSVYTVGANSYVDASKANGAAYLDAAFAVTQEYAGQQWPGWLYNGDPLDNNATLDAAGFNNISLKPAWQVVDQSKGWDGSLLYSPTSNVQIVLSGSIDATVTRLNGGVWPKYPYPQDRWAVWYFQNSSFGLGGLPLATAYTNPADTSTRTAAGTYPGDDTPKYAGDLFVNYKLSGSLKGLSVGVGTKWHSREAFFTGVTHGGGQVQVNAEGLPIVATSASQLTVNLFAKYEFKRGLYRQYVQLNVDNALNDTKLYGLIYNPPLTAKISYGIGF